MSREKFYKWTVEFQVAASWVADGFDLTNDRAKQMIEESLPYAYGAESRARVLSAPDAKAIRKEQGYSD